MNSIVRFGVVLLLFFAPGANLSAQWKLVAPNVIVPIARPYNGGGVLISHNGILWAGYHDIWMSADTGKSWSMRTPFDGLDNSCVKDIYFLDDNTGLLATQNGEIFTTNDQGLSWTQHVPQHPYRFRPSIESACFCGTPKDIIACTYAGDRYVSNDGGMTWSVTIVDSLASKVIAGSGGTAYLIGGLLTGSWLYETNDFGATWVQIPGLFNWDSYSFARDQCDTSVFYVANDNYEQPQPDKSSKFFVSTNTGLSWNAYDPHPAPYYCGSVVAASHTIFAQTFSGISRSTDQGNYWKDIGGPPNIEDTRFVTALNDNIIVAVDSLGSVWVTYNSGGDSLAVIDGKSIFLQTADQKTDTLGGTVAVPISVNGLMRPQDVEMAIHYNTQLIYKGTFSLANVKLDIPFESWSGRSKIHIPEANSATVLAYAYFDVFSDSQKITVSFDSLRAAITSCSNLLSTSATSVITPLSGCGIVTVNSFLRDSSFPGLTMFPNPASGDIALISSADLGEVNIVIYDMLGIKQSEKIMTIRKNSPAKLSLPDANGVYHVMVNTRSKIYNLRVVVQK